jgi:hypothetical protein
MVPVTDENDFVPLNRFYTAVITPVDKSAKVIRDPSVTVNFNESLNAFVFDNLIFNNVPFTTNQFSIRSEGI